MTNNEQMEPPDGVAVDYVDSEGRPVSFSLTGCNLTHEQVARALGLVRVAATDEGVAGC